MILSKAEYFYLWLQNLSLDSFSPKFLSVFRFRVGSSTATTLTRLSFIDERKREKKKIHGKFFLRFKNIFQEVTHLAARKDKSNNSLGTINLVLNFLWFLIIRLNEGSASLKVMEDYDKSHSSSAYLTPAHSFEMHFLIVVILSAFAIHTSLV